eukprot:6557867-Prymnesium_polylepis.1
MSRCLPRLSGSPGRAMRSGVMSRFLGREICTVTFVWGLPISTQLYGEQTQDDLSPDKLVWPMMRPEA